MAVHAWTEGQRIYVRTPYEFKDIMKSITGGRWDKRNKAWHYPRSHRTLAEIMKSLPGPIGLSEDLLQMLEEGDPYEQAAPIKEATDLPNPPICNGDDWLHQRRAYWWAKDLPAVLLDMWMGSGKTRTAINIIQNWYPEGNARVLIVCPPNVVPVWEEQIAQHAAIPWKVTLLPAGKPIPKRVEMAEKAWQDTEPGVIAALVVNYEAVWRGKLGEWVLSKEWDAVIGDECVEEGTLIATPEGDKKIENIKVSDTVLGYKDGHVVETKVLHTFKRQTNEKLIDLGPVRVTPNHPIFVKDKGYIEARNLDMMGDIVLKLHRGDNSDIAKMRMVRERILCGTQNEQGKAEKILQPQLFCQVEDVKPRTFEKIGYPKTSKSSKRAHEKTQQRSSIQSKSAGIFTLKQKSIQKSRNCANYKTESNNDVKRKRQFCSFKWRKRARPNCSSKIISKSFGMENGTYNTYKNACEAWVSDKLQSRHSRPNFKNSYRSRWTKTYGENAASIGQKERRLFGRTWLEGIARNKQRSNGRLRRCGQESNGSCQVYNLETETGNYFAGGILVHNCHHLKSPGSKQSLFFAKLHKISKRRLGLTGTPLHDGPLDIYGQARFLCPEVFGTSFANFRSRYARMGGYGGYQVLGYQNLDEFYEKYRSFTFSVSADEALPDLPPILFERRVCELNSEEKKVYISLENDLIAQVREGLVTVSNALTKLIKLQQVTSGYVRDDLGFDRYVGDSKKRLLANVLADLPKEDPVVVFCRFTHDLDVVHEVARLDGRRSFELSGRRRDLKEWTHSKGGDVIAVQLKAGGEGVPMHRARYVIDYSLSFSLGEYNQTRSRLQRPEQTRQVVSIALVASGTVDEQIYRALKRKEKVIETIMKGFGANE